MGLIMEQLAQRGVHNHYSLAYQSRVGPARSTPLPLLILNPMKLSSSLSLVSPLQRWSINQGWRRPSLHAWASCK